MLARVKMTPSFPPFRPEGGNLTHMVHILICPEVKKTSRKKSRYVIRNERILAFQLDREVRAFFLRNAVPCCGDI